MATLGVPVRFGDHRAIELLVDAGFTPLEAIRIGTLNGAADLGRADQIGSVTPGKIAVVFKDGIGYDPEKLLETVRGRYGQS